jgi:nucleoporin NUP82
VRHVKYISPVNREYDISVDIEEPQQILSFVPERKSGAFGAEDESEREVTSFTLGKGRADWGPLTVYALMRSGDIYSICPYLPQNAYVETCLASKAKLTYHP